MPSITYCRSLVAIYLSLVDIIWFRKYRDLEIRTSHSRSPKLLPFNRLVMVSY